MNSDSCCDWKTCNAKLEYFGVNGRAGLIRSILYWKGVPFEDVRLDHATWGPLKKTGNYEFEQLPAFECNGIRMFQSGAIVLWLARQFDLLGSNANEEYLHTSLLFSLEDILPKVIPAVFAMSEEGKAKMETVRNDFFKVHGPFYLGVWEKRFLNNCGQYAVGEKLGLSDFIFTYFLHNIFRNPQRKDIWEPLLLDYAPNLAKHIQKIHDNELAPFFSKGYINEAPL
jgi:glutathione S-transferase